MALHDVLGPGVRIRVGAETRIVRPKRLIGRVGNSIPLIESLICRKPTLGVTEVPLAENTGGVTGVREHLCHGDFPLHEAIDGSIDRHRAVARAYRIPSGYRPVIRAARLGVHCASTL